MEAMPVRMLCELVGILDYGSLERERVGFVNVYRNGFAGAVYGTRLMAQQAALHNLPLAYRIKITCKPALRREEDR